jgi:predicted GH43/DUF377 family glycosyl hydrolase
MGIWEKKGLIYCPDCHLSWAKHYTTVPTARILDERIRIYFSALDENNFGRIGYVDVAKDNPAQLLAQPETPFFDLGEPGTFDDSGVLPSCFVEVGDRIHMYYIGFQRLERAPYMIFAGLAISEDNGETFVRHTKTPMLERTSREPFVRSGTTVLYDNGMFRVWYVSALGWIDIDGRPLPECVIRYAESPDGINWNATDVISIETNVEAGEYSISRPWIMKDNNKYRLWYSIRSKNRPYRIGYAESSDGIRWQRMDDEVGIYASSTGWDSEMVCYANVIQVNQQLMMFHNGNQHGRTGFGYAIWQP